VGRFGEFAAGGGGGAVVLFGAAVADFGGGAEAAGSFHFKVMVEFGAFENAAGVAAETAFVGLDLDGELDGIKKSAGGFVVDACVEHGVLDFHDGEKNCGRAVEDGKFDAGVLVHSDGATESHTTLLAAFPLVVEITFGVMTERESTAFYAVGFDVGAGSGHRVSKSEVGSRKKPLAISH
jgi:hypothetical protein